MKSTAIALALAALSALAVGAESDENPGVRGLRLQDTSKSAKTAKTGTSGGHLDAKAKYHKEHSTKAAKIFKSKSKHAKSAKAMHVYAKSAKAAHATGTDGEVGNARRLKATLAYLIEKRVSHPDALARPGNENDLLGDDDLLTPQYRAALWIAREDAFRISVPAVDATDEEGCPFRQRYALAVLFFATGGRRRKGGGQWLLDLGFLSGAHECRWKNSFVFTATRGRIRSGCSATGLLP